MTCELILRSHFAQLHLISGLYCVNDLEMIPFT